jgi:nudix-type nucleoside diphosphatase (YffH/AdpP family)
MSLNFGFRPEFGAPEIPLLSHSLGDATHTLWRTIRMVDAVVSAIFFYGSLRDHELLEIVLGRRVDPSHLEPARADEFATLRLATEVYPMLIPAADRQADGVVVRHITEVDIARLAFFEEAEYDLAPITITCASGQCEAHYFRATSKPAGSTEYWDFAAWRRDHRGVAIEATREYMHHFGRLPVEAVDTIWPGIKIRAYQHALAMVSAPKLGTLRTEFGTGDVDQHSLTRSYTGFLAVQELKLRHRRFDGSWTGSLDRTVVAWGDAVSVLPYDPGRDRVLLIEQFRPAPAARGDRNPWCIEAIAGRLDTGETPERTARREATEEAGLTLGRIVEIAAYYPSPGLACEHITAFVGEADLADAGGLHGLADEGEDIRTIVLGVDEAMAAIHSGAVNSGNALVSLLWLAVNRQRLRDKWL